MQFKRVQETSVFETLSSTVEFFLFAMDGLCYCKDWPNMIDLKLINIKLIKRWLKIDKHAKQNDQQQIIWYSRTGCDSWKSSFFLVFQLFFVSVF